MGTSLSVVGQMAQRFNMVPAEFEAVVKKTVCPANISNEQFVAFLMVANEYHLNPIIKQIYAFPAKGGGIVPVVSIDGWLRVINDRPQFDGMEFVDQIENGKLTAVTCKMYRKDRSHPTEVTEYLCECKRSTDTWSQWPARMLRHKATIQAARYAFGLSGIYDEDEAQRIAGDKETEKVINPILPVYPTDKFDANLPAWKKHITAGKQTPEQIIALVSSKYILGEEQQAAIRALAHIDNDGVIDSDFVAAMEKQKAA